MPNKKRRKRNWDPVHFNAQLKDGRTVELFVNPETRLVVVDVIEKGGQCGNEFVRCTAPSAMTAKEQRELKAAIDAQPPPTFS